MIGTDAPFVEKGPAVYYATEKVVLMDAAAVSLARTAAADAASARARLCAHPNPRAAQHDMLIVAKGGTYIRPHRHIGRTETLTVMGGRAEALLFDDEGRLDRRFTLTTIDDGGIFFYRMPSGRFHSLVVEGEEFIFLETTIGPFDVSTTEQAPWAPVDVNEGSAWLEEVMRRDPGTAPGT